MRAVFVSGLAAFTAKAVVAEESPIPGYTIVPMTWEIEVAPGQTEFLNGTIEEAYVQAMEINPNFKPPSIDKYIPTTRSDSQSTTGQTDVDCDLWEWATAGRIVEGIDYLRSIAGPARAPRGPKICSRVSCSWNSAIFWCNDNVGRLTLGSWGMIADSARHLLNMCSKDNKVSGRNYEAYNWNTAIRRDSC